MAESNSQNLSVFLAPKFPIVHHAIEEERFSNACHSFSQYKSRSIYKLLAIKYPAQSYTSFNASSLQNNTVIHQHELDRLNKAFYDVSKDEYDNVAGNLNGIYFEDLGKL